MRGLPRPNCHSHGLTLCTLLPLWPSAAAASAVPNWNALLLRCSNLCGMEGACVPCVLDGHVGGILQTEGVRRKNKATILAQYRQTGISQDIPQCMCLIRYNLG